MKVIKNSYKVFPINATCDNCASEVELETWDDLASTSKIPNRNNKFDYIWYCPRCNYCNEVEI